MLNIEKTSKIITDKINEEKKLTEDEKEIITYGIYSFLQMSIAIGLIAIVAIMFNVFWEAMIISFTMAILRKSSGGAHAKTPLACSINGVLISVIPAIFVAKHNFNIVNIIIEGSILYLLSYILLYKLAPVDSIKKPINSAKKIKKLKRKSIITLSIYLAITLVLISAYIIFKNEKFLQYTYSIYIGIFLQVLSITSLGKNIISIMDFFYKS